ncbi:MAG: hypothetical protein HW389_2341 [Bacteroidetes bacterium]|nr:hypothetical protein [Bacteroidota bacterium]
MGAEPELSELSFVTLRVFDILGREVATLVNDVRSPGTHVVRWDALGQPSGIYLYRLQARVMSGGQGRALIATKKMLVVR